jgi:hypothetical protein
LTAWACGRIVVIDPNLKVIKVWIARRLKVKRLVFLTIARMRRYSVKETTFFWLTALGVMALAPAASASVIGNFSVANIGGGGVTASNMVIDWFPPNNPLGNGNGMILTGGDTTLTYFNGVSTVALGTDTAGTVNDLPGPPGAVGFFAFPSAPALHWTLLAVGPGVSNTVCAGLLTGQSCSMFAGSPFILTATSTGSLVTLDASGIVTDASPFTSNWMGAFTTQIAGVSAASIQSTINSGGSLTSTFSGEFVAVVPEPLTLALIGGGLIALAVLKRRKA